MSDSLVTLRTCSLPASSVRGISQARILEFAISFNRGSSQLRDRARISCTGSEFFTTGPPGKPVCVNTHLYVTVGGAGVRQTGVSMLREEGGCGEGR